MTLTGVVGGDLVNRESDKLPRPFDREKKSTEKKWVLKKLGEIFVFCHDMSSEIQTVVDHSSCVFHDLHFRPKFSTSHNTG